MSNSQYAAFNCYDVLGVPFQATPDQIRQAWKQESFKYHPDRGGSHDKQSCVNAAYDILKDPIARQAHDTYWKVDRTFYHWEKTLDEFSKEQQQANPKENKPQQRQASDEPLFAFKERIYQGIYRRRTAIWQDLDKKTSACETEFRKEFNQSKRGVVYKSLAVMASSLMAGYEPILWLITIGFGWSLLPNLLGIEIQEKRFFFFDPQVQEKLRTHAHFIASENCRNEIETLDKYMASLASFCELIIRSSSLDDSEEQVARRLAVCMFLMGYKPVYYGSRDRTMLFKDGGEERILVRFRHRGGPAANISYVKTLVSQMQKHNIPSGLLFSSPGLSGQAQQYADQNSVKSYSLESMNEWIDQILQSSYDGPKGDALSNLRELRQFLRQISYKLSARRQNKNKLNDKNKLNAA
jgi:hypothetical protein